MNRAVFWMGNVEVRGMLFVQMNANAEEEEKERRNNERSQSRLVSCNQGRGAQASKISIPVVGSRPFTCVAGNRGPSARIPILEPFKSVLEVPDRSS